MDSPTSVVNARPPRISLPNPDHIGQSEYRAIHEILTSGDAVDVAGDVHNARLALASLDQIAEWADELSLRIRKAVLLAEAAT